MDALLAFLRQDPHASKEEEEENASDKALRRHLQHALDLISSLLTLFPLEHLALTFNGGKDACVVFYLVRAALALRGVTSKGELARVKVLYFAPKHGEFPEVTSFMEEVAATFDFTYTVYPPGCSYQEGMRDLVEREELKAVFLGVRSGDPYSCM
jgi:FAD synthetase